MTSRSDKTSTNLPLGRPVHLTPHDPDWKYQAEAALLCLKELLPQQIAASHHIGSTAIPGMMSKPIIDLLLEINSLEAFDASVQLIHQLGYQAWGEAGISHRRFFTKDDPESKSRKIHLHCFPKGDQAIEKHLLFRNTLRQSPELAARYEAVKMHCRKMHPDDSMEYSDSKEDFFIEFFTAFF